jgi:hypothetical protein
MAKAEATAEGATPEKKEGAAGKRKKTFKKRGEKRIVHHAWRTSRRRSTTPW